VSEDPIAGIEQRDLIADGDDITGQLLTRYPGATRSGDTDRQSERDRQDAH
jgi:hypothetical protein